MHKATIIARQDNAVGFYRLVQPLRFLKREGFVKDARMTPFSGAQVWGEDKQGVMLFNDKVFLAICENTDVIWTNHLTNKDEMLKLLNLRKLYNTKLVIDVDDNLYGVSSDNPGQRAAQAMRDNLELGFKIADGLTVSVPSLKELYSPFNKNIFVNPNGIDFSIFDTLKVKGHKGLRIGWEGAYGHKADLEMIAPVIKALKKDYDFTFVIFGLSERDIKLDFEAEYQAWVSFGDENDKHKVSYPYYEKLASLGLDIALAPLIDSSYNRCKSNLRVLEHSALKIPMVVSPTVNQKNMPVLYASSRYEWYEQIKSLLESKPLLKELGERQYVFVRKNFDMKQLVRPLAHFFDNLPRSTALEPTLR